jgi:hypothetical protein
MALPRAPTPLFTYRIRQMQPARIRRDSILLCAAGIALGVGLWLYCRRNPELYSNAGGVLLYSTFAFVLVADVFYIAMTISIVQQMYANRQWEELHLTALSSESIVASEFAILQMRLWRIMAAECAVRLALVALFVLRLFSMPNVFLRNYFDLVAFWFVSVYGFIYALEPLWRMRALSVCTLSLSIRLRVPTIAGMLSFLFGLLLHAIVAGNLLVGLILINRILSLGSWSGTPNLSEVIGSVGVVSIAMGVWFIIYGSYRIATINTLRALARRFERAEFN